MCKGLEPVASFNLDLGRPAGNLTIAAIDQVLQDVSARAIGCGDGGPAIEASITDYGVIMYIVSDTDVSGGPYDVYLYKHGEASIPVTPGAPPNLRAE